MTLYATGTVVEMCMSGNYTKKWITQLYNYQLHFLLAYIQSKDKNVNYPCALTEHHTTMKAYWGSGSIAPRILDLGTRWR
jgi:hypothetical protein